MRIRNLFFIILSLTCLKVSAQDAVSGMMKTELERNFSILSKEDIPAYYIFLRMEESKVLMYNGRMGKLHSVIKEPIASRYLSSMVRVGDRILDNTHEIRESGGGGNNVWADPVPVEEVNPKAIKMSIWSMLDGLYKDAAKTYEVVKANMAVKVEQEDKSPDFSEEKAEKYYEAPLSVVESYQDFSPWENKVKMYSAVFSNNPEILDGAAVFYVSQSRQWIVDTEGREIVQNKISYNLSLAASTIADDGMELPLYKSWYAESMEEMPSDSEVLAAAEAISQNLLALKRAPVVESFSGPAILSPDAAGVFFHEIFGHRVEGARMKQEQDAQTFKKKIGEVVLPKHFSVTFDPTIRSYNKHLLSGHYRYDDEGIRSQRVEVVKKGVLNDFLMCRTPIEGFLKSNGHGRAQVGLQPVSRQSNMLVESTQKNSREQLRKILIKEAKSQKKEYAYYFKDVSGGFTTTGRYMPNSFNVTPLLVYRIYVDGRPDELVRGVDLVGTPLAMFAQIEACGEDYAVFNGTCGAESGGVPVSCYAPSVFVKRIETQKRGKEQSQPPVLPRPKAESKGSSEIISKAIREEVQRALKGLKMEGLKSPFFISYTVGDFETLNISAQLGSIVSSTYYPNRSSATRMLIGDYKFSDENFSGSVGGATTYDGTPCIENDEEGIRYTVWRDLDAIYKRAAETYEQKVSAFKQLNIPEADRDLHDWDTVPVVRLKDIPDIKVDFTKQKYEDLAKQISAVFKDYKDIISSDVSVQIGKSVLHFYNTEGSEYTLPRAYAFVGVVAVAMTEKGERVGKQIEFVRSHPDDLPSLDVIKAACVSLANKVLEMKKAPDIQESYTGPILFEDQAVMETFYSNFFGGNSLAAYRQPVSPSGYAYGGNSLEEMIGKRITAKEITIEDLTGSKEYKGQPLIGYTPVDAEGVIPPQKLVLVENGILQTLLNGRVPTRKVPHSNGHSLYGLGLGARTGTGVIRMSDTRGQSMDELKKQLFARAKEEGYEYAYIVRRAASGGSIPQELYRVKPDGSEELVRSAKLNNIDDQVFKKVIAVSGEEKIHHAVYSGLTSVIVPKAILFEDISIQKDMVDNYQKPPIVPMPD